MAPRRPDLRGLAVAVLLLAPGAARAQVAPTTLVTPDGSRFVLVPMPALPHVQWAVASWADPADEPPGCEGLALATMYASLHGTWRTGSLDPQRERDALRELDLAAARPSEGPGAAAAAATLRDRQAAAWALGDVLQFPRALAAAPTWRPEVVDRGAVAVLVLTTVADAIDDVGRLLVERREDQALRRLPEAWREVAAARTRQHRGGTAAVARAELLALTMPGHPVARLLVPPTGTPRREQALATWAATQRPERTVHVLLGRFDPEPCAAVLRTVFAATALPPHQALAAPPLRPLSGVRRSQVTGEARPTVAIAFVLPPVADRHLLAATVRWLAGGPDSVLGRELQRAGRATATLRADAPWPGGPDGQGLLLIEASDDRDLAGVADLLVRACREAAATAPDAAGLQAVAAALQHEWREAVPDDRSLAGEIAVAALRWPGTPLTTAVPDTVEPGRVQDLLRRLVAGHPAIVEARP